MKKALFPSLIVAVTFLLGGVFFQLLPRSRSISSESKVYLDSKVDGINQRSISRMPQVKVFQNYLDYIMHGDYVGAWNLLTPDRQSRFESLDNLIYTYCLSNSFDIHYVIPLDNDSFYVFLSFNDAVDMSEMMNTKAFLEFVPIVSNDQEAGIAVVFQDGRVSEEMFEFIKKRFIIEDETIVRQQIDSFLIHRSMTELVASDWRTPILIAQSLNLKPKDRKDCKFSVNYPENHLIIQYVSVKKFNNGEWKLDDIHTEAISSWKH